jgi:hypothetical protein
MSYQGVLTDGSGISVADGDYSLTFALYTDPSGGTALWTEVQPTVSVARGVFSVTLGSLTPLNLPFDQEYWLGVSVGSDPELEPRTRLTASPYALALRTPLPGIAQAVRAGGYPVAGNVNPGADALLRDLNLTIDVPAAGFVVVQVSGHVQIVNVPAGEQQFVKYQISETTGLAAITVPSEWGFYNWAGFGFAPNNGYYDWPLACQRAFVVTPGQHRFSFCTGRLGSYTPSADVGNVVMTAVYYPTSYGTVTAAPSGPPSPVPTAAGHDDRGASRPGAAPDPGARP